MLRSEIEQRDHAHPAITLPRRAALASGSFFSRSRRPRPKCRSSWISIFSASMTNSCVVEALLARRAGAGARCRTSSDPSARVARYAVTAESTPPDTIDDCSVEPRRLISSRMKWTSHAAVIAPSISNEVGGASRVVSARDDRGQLGWGDGRPEGPGWSRFDALRGVEFQRSRARRPSPHRGLDRRCGIITSRSAINGASARARVASSRSMVPQMIDPSQSAPRPRTPRRTTPLGPTTVQAEDQGKPFPLRFRPDSTMSRRYHARRRCRESGAPQRLTLAGPGGSIVPRPRAPCRCGADDEDRLRAIGERRSSRSGCARRLRTPTWRLAPTAYRRPGPRVLARQIALRRTTHTSAERAFLMNVLNRRHDPRPV